MSTMLKLPVTEVDLACFHNIRSLTLLGNQVKYKRFLRGRKRPPDGRILDCGLWISDWQWSSFAVRREPSIG